jgi:hypothetical protein
MKTNIILLLIAISFSNCTSLNSHQKRELADWKAKDLSVEEKSPGTAAALNLLPGIGDFYNGNVGLGIGNLLTWPLSILWAPVGGASGADEVNYYASKAQIDKLETSRKQAKIKVEEAFIGGRISKEQFYVANKKIDGMSLSDFKSNFDVSEIIDDKKFLHERIPSSKK